MAELRFTVWQFVRLMVQMEETLKAREDAALRLLWQDWDDIWLDLDARLETLGREKPDAFADLMMNQEVVITDASTGQIALAVREIERVAAAMRARLKRERDPEAKRDLTFEAAELEDLAKAFRRLLPGGGPPARRSRTP